MFKNKKNSSLNIEISDRLQKVRKQLKYSQKDFGKALGYNQSYYSEVENGKKSVTLRLIESLKNVFDISSAWMHTGEGVVFIAKNETKGTSENAPVLTNLEKKVISEEFTEEEIRKYWNEYKERLKLSKPKGKASELIDNQLRIANDVLSFTPYTNEEYKIFKEDFETLKKFQYNYSELFESEIIKQLLEPIELAAKYPMASYFELEEALKVDFEHFKKFAKLLSRLTLAIREFSEAAGHFSEEETGVSPNNWSLNFHIIPTNR